MALTLTQYTTSKMLLLRQVDDFAVAHKYPSASEKVISNIQSKMTIQTLPWDLTSRYNGINIEQMQYSTSNYQ
jgi:hypothetical protein